jgi:hypothetical protein
MSAHPAGGLAHVSATIPPAVLERGQRAFVSVLRGDFPDACFVVRDCAVRPEDADVAGKVGTGAAADLDAVEKAAENRAATSDIKASPKRRKRPSRRNPGQAGR